MNEFKDHVVQNPDKFIVTDNPDGTKTIKPFWVENPADILQAGTPFNAAAFNAIPAEIAAIDQKVTSQLADKVSQAEVLTLVGDVSSGTPLFATNTAGMTDTSRNYVNTTDGLLYTHNGTAWVSTGVAYQATGIADGSVTLTKADTFLRDIVLDGKTSALQNLISYVQGTTNFSATKTFIIDKPTTLPVTLKKIRIFSDGGNVVITVFRKTDVNTFECVEKTTLVTTVGDATYDVDIPLDEANLYVGISGKGNYKLSGTYNFWDVSDVTIEPGDSVSGTRSVDKLDFGIGVEFVYESAVYKEAVSSTVSLDRLDDEVKSLLSTNSFPKDIKPVYSELFTSNNSNWVYENCAPNNGLNLLNSAKAYFNKYLTFDTFYMKSVMTVKNIASVFGLVCNHNQKGAVYIVDGATNSIKLYGHYTGGALPTNVKAQTALPSGFLVANKNYRLDVYKRGWKHTFSITDIQTGEKVTVEFDNQLLDSSQYAGKGWGRPGVILTAGEVFVRNHSHSLGKYPDPKIVFIGDSITEGTNLQADIKNRWCGQLRDKLYHGDAMIMGRGGATAGDLKARLQVAYDIGVTADIVVVLIGTNQRSDAEFAFWQTSIVEIYDLIVANGGVPVIAVPPIPNSGSSYILQMRDFILNKGWNTIRFDYATTINRDGATYDATMYTDGVHPNVKGSNAMYQQALSDLGYM